MPVDIRGEASTQYIELMGISTGEPVIDPDIQAGDVTVSKDGGAFVPITTLPTVNPAGTPQVEFDLSVAEKTADIIRVRFKDVSDDEWLETVYEIQTVENTYQAKLEMIDDDSGTTDRYIVSWFKNSEPINSGITGTTLQVIKVSDGTDLIATTAMTQVSGTSNYHYPATGASRMVSGVAYIAIASATIDGETREWRQPIGVDS